MPYRIAIALVAVLVQPSDPPREYVAFRVDDERVIAVLKTFDDSGVERRENGVSEKSVAAYGFPMFEPPATWLKFVPAAIRPGDRWRLHVSGERAVDAVAERVVGGQAQCLGAVGMLMRIVPEHARDFAAIRWRYFVAREAASSQPAPAAENRIGFLPESVATPELRAAVESALGDLLRREHPKIVKEAADDVTRIEASGLKSHKKLAERWRRQDDALSRGQARLTYDIQGVRVTREGPPLFFVRAEWFVGDFQAFAAAAWFSFGEKLELVQADVRPASWLRMAIFQGTIYRIQIGMILNVLDRDADGWGEILFAQGGYESLGVSLLEYSPSGFDPQGVEFNYGC